MYSYSVGFKKKRLLTKQKSNTVGTDIDAISMNWKSYTDKTGDRVGKLSFTAALNSSEIASFT